MPAPLDDALGYARSRLVRHSAEREGPLPSPDVTDALTVAIAPEGIVLAGDTALLGHGLAPLPADRLLTIYLGKSDDRPVFAASLSSEAGARLTESSSVDVLDLRSLASAGRVAPDELGLVATARSFLSWHARHGYCANCGVPTTIAAGGFRRDCASCGTHHFPRTDPVAIMLVTRGNACLLGRSPGWPEGMFSCLAGFIEPGETVEMAVRREVWEEAGVRVGPVAYVASQPWPFPASLMLGARAEALSEEITIDPSEIEDALWVSRERMARIVADRDEAIRAPREGAVAGWLLRAWLADALG